MKRVSRFHLPEVGIYPNFLILLSDCYHFLALPSG